MVSQSSRLVRGKALVSLYALLGLYAFVLNMIGPAVPFLRLEFNLDYSTAALHQSAFALGQVVSGLLASVLLARIGLGRSLFFGMTGIFAGLTGLVLAPTPWASLASILFMSLAGTFAFASLQASISGFGGERAGQALMEANIVASLTSAAAPFVLVLGTAVGLGWRALWPAFALALAITAGLGSKPVARGLPALHREVADGGGRKRLPLSFLGPCLLVFFGVGVEWSVGFWATEYLKGLPGHSLSLAAAGAGVFQLAAVLGRLASSRLMARVRERRILLGAILLVAVGFPFYWMRHDPVTAFLGLALCGAGVSIFYPLSLSLGMAASGGNTAAASALCAVSGGLAIFAMPLLLGIVADHAGLPAALFAIPAGLAAMLVLLAIRRHKAARQAGA